jgi:hypothetical protein
MRSRANRGLGVAQAVAAIGAAQHVKFQFLTADQDRWDVNEWFAVAAWPSLP